jgi:outer membrane protein, multidrug efflux system
MTVRSPACALLLAGLLAGRAVGPDYRTPDAVLPVAFLTQPAVKEPASGGASPDRWQWWWRTLRAPQLNSLIERALQKRARRRRIRANLAGYRRPGQTA